MPNRIERIAIAGASSEDWTRSNGTKLLHIDDQWSGKDLDVGELS